MYLMKKCFSWHPDYGTRGVCSPFTVYMVTLQCTVTMYIICQPQLLTINMIHQSRNGTPRPRQECLGLPNTFISCLQYLNPICSCLLEPNPLYHYILSFVTKVFIIQTFMRQSINIGLQYYHYQSKLTLHVSVF